MSKNKLKLTIIYSNVLVNSIFRLFENIKKASFLTMLFTLIILLISYFFTVNTLDKLNPKLTSPLPHVRVVLVINAFSFMPFELEKCN